MQSKAEGPGSPSPSSRRSTPATKPRNRALYATDDLRRRLPEVAFLVVLAVLLATDLVADAGGSAWGHVALELGATIVATLAAARLVVQWARARRVLEESVNELRGHLRDATAEAARWRTEAQSALAGLGEAIDRQCDRWGLTEAERDVALLVLKGLSMKEIADARGTAERTARQQALAVYRKAGLGGRAELSAFFLEDLLLPSSAAGAKPQP